ncbi:ScbR family autoregulator-binding transcription factor [Streptomyces sp. SL13]|jgi:AcrR family transcriptional regulator|uniref:ScbR family autoregulator-binding transcription factor n=1 Tax=Streptantibioticus silvisoli TaxID=2705255 RepID=A0AA90K818_9ACTN|nr:ScbR family autoregulator-binding transcription factor [Streptantibioticus silvisoli]MDI5965414.1 ScbR family autoregulator-binding transcription factor [Streptantibioticus silvisoli]MDI5968937.1 ScbR family autoregulator-binding transcription factor [Streptantibioticus silvisoli]
MAQTRAVRTRATIVRAAGELFGERGYHGASTTDILERCGLTRGALYFHFPSKEAIADAVVDHQAQALSAPERESPLQATIALTFAYADSLLRDPVMRGAVRLAVEQGTYRKPDAAPYEGPQEAVLGLFLQAEARGELLTTADPHAIARLMVAAFTGVQLVSDALTGRGDLMERLTDLWRYLLPGIANPGLLPHLRVPDLDS